VEFPAGQAACYLDAEGQQVSDSVDVWDEAYACYCGQSLLHLKCINRFHYGCRNIRASSPEYACRDSTTGNETSVFDGVYSSPGWL
jgi:hypothetical protein